MFKRSLEHEGVDFPAAFNPSGKPLVCSFGSVKLTPDAEEISLMWSKYKGKTKIAEKNFKADFASMFGVNVDSSCDFEVNKKVKKKVE